MTPASHPAARGGAAARRPCRNGSGVNGVARRAADALGAIRAVPFSTADVDLLTGAAALRRRFLDVVVGQLNPPHAGALSRYQRALTQRNALLRQIGQGAAAAAQLEQWDDLAAREAGPIWQARAEAASWLADRAAQRHRALQDANEALHLSYEPALSDDRSRPPIRPPGPRRCATPCAPAVPAIWRAASPMSGRTATIC